MKNTKILSLALAAFMLTGCNLFNKGSTKAEWKDYTFAADDSVDYLERNVILTKVAANLENFSEASISSNEYVLSTNQTETTAKVAQKVVAYKDEVVDQTTDYSVVTKQGGISTEQSVKMDTLVFLASHEEAGETKLYQLTRQEFDGSVTYGRTSFTLGNKFYSQFVAFVSLSPSINMWKVKDGYQMLSSSCSETHEDVTFGTGVREKISTHKTQTLYNISSDYKITTGYNYEESLSNVDPDGVWHDKTVVIQKNESIGEFKYAERKEYKDLHNAGLEFMSPYFVSKSVTTYGDLRTGTTHTSATFAESNYEASTKQTSPNTFHVTYYGHFVFSETCNGLRIRVNTYFLENYYASSNENKYTELSLDSLSNKFEFATETTGGGDYYAYNTAKEGVNQVTFKLEFDVSISSSKELYVDNLAATLID